MEFILTAEPDAVAGRIVTAESTESAMAAARVAFTMRNGTRSRGARTRSIGSSPNRFRRALPDGPGRGAPVPVVGKRPTAFLRPTSSGRVTGDRSAAPRTVHVAGVRLTASPASGGVRGVHAGR